MKAVSGAVVALMLGVSLSGCGLEAERPNIWFRNNSDQTVVLQAMTKFGPVNEVTAKPHTTEWSAGSPPKGKCDSDWEIVDSGGRLLKKVDRVCAYDTVVYP